MHRSSHGFFQIIHFPLASVFNNTVWLAQLASLTDIFSKLNDLNLSMQGRGTNILNCYDKVNAFIMKTEFWESTNMETKTLPVFHYFVPVTAVCTGENEHSKIKEITVDHLAHLPSEFKSYFPNIQHNSAQLGQKRIHLVTLAAITSISQQENLLELSSDCGVQMKRGRDPQKFGNCWLIGRSVESRTISWSGFFKISQFHIFRCLHLKFQGGVIMGVPTQESGGGKGRWQGYYRGMYGAIAGSRGITTLTSALLLARAPPSELGSQRGRLLTGHPGLKPELLPEAVVYHLLFPNFILRNG
ncbi:unnamed protein product [Lepidochelys olivacea]